jgi:signal transduction histidine kinase
MFALKQCIATLWSLLAAGFARILVGQEMPPGALPAIQSTLLPLTIAAGIAFVAALLNSYGLTRRWTGLLLGLVAGFALLPLMQIVGLMREIRIVTNALLPLVFLCLALGLASVVRRRIDPSLPKIMLSAYLCTYGVLLSIPAVVNLGGVDALASWTTPARHAVVSPPGAPISPWELLAVYASIFSLMLDGFVMRVLLMRRAHERRQAQRATELKLQRSEEATKARERLNEEQSRLFSMLAHEMKTPLATLSMWTHAGSAGVPAMNRAISEMNLIIERCVHAGQVMEDGLQPIVQEGDALVQTKATIAGCRAPERFELTAPDGDAPLTADLQMLSIVLANLFDNAVKYSAAQAPIEVCLQAQSHEGRPGWRWEIRNAPGLAGMPDPGRLFEKYYRSDGARHQSGSGLGLFLVRSLIDLMGGTIRFEEREGRVVFETWVPAAPDKR